MVGTKGHICIRYSGNGTQSKLLTSLSVAVKGVDADFDNVLVNIANSFADDDHSDIQSYTTTGQHEELACVRR